MGPAISQGVILESVSMLHEAPTFAHLLGLKFPNAEGRVLTELLR